MTTTMMSNKKSAALLLLLVAAATNIGSTDAALRRKEESNYNGKLVKEDEDFWTRYLNEMGSSVTPEPSPPPTPSPSEPPVPAETSPPVPEPTPPPVPDPTPPPTPEPNPDPTPPPTPGPVPDPTPPPTPEPNPLPPPGTPDPTPSPTDAPTPTPGECAGSGQITCTIAPGEMNAGEPCPGNLVVPDGVCSGGDTVETVTFGVKFCTCDESDNTQSGFAESCSDAAEIPEGETVRLTCSDSEDNLLFSQNVVEGDEVVMSAEGGLPEEVICSVFSVSGDLLQTFSVNPSGSENLFLTEKFGSLTLLGCDDQDCSATVLYTYEICNTGDIDLEATDPTQSNFNGEITDLLPDVTPNPIPPGTCAEAQQTEVINICEVECYDNEFVLTDTTGNCGDVVTDNFCVPTPPPTTPDPTPAPSLPPVPAPTDPPVTAAPTPGPTVECVIDFEITCPECEIDGTTVQPCNERPINMTMLYAGFGCDRAEGENCQEEGKYCCSDYNGGPPQEYGVESYILATDEDGEVIFFNGTVESGTAYEMFNREEPGERFPADQMIRVYSSSDIENPDNLLQKVLYHSSCSQNLDLLNSFGSHTIIGWCDEEGLCVSGFDNQDFTIDISLPIEFEGSTGTINSLLVATTATSEVEGTIDPVFYNLTDGVYGTPLPASVNVSVPIDLTVERSYNYLVTLEVELEDGTICTGVDLLNFTEGGANIGPTGGGICADAYFDPEADFSCEAEDRRELLKLEKSFTVRRGGKQ